MTVDAALLARDGPVFGDAVAFVERRLPSKVRLQSRIGNSSIAACRRAVRRAQSSRDTIFACQLWMALIPQTFPSISSLFSQPSNAPDS